MKRNRCRREGPRQGPHFHQASTRQCNVGISSCNFKANTQIIYTHFEVLTTLFHQPPAYSHPFSRCRDREPTRGVIIHPRGYRILKLMRSCEVHATFHSPIIPLVKWEVHAQLGTVFEGQTGFQGRPHTSKRIGEVCRNENVRLGNRYLVVDVLLAKPRMALSASFSP